MDHIEIYILTRDRSSYLRESLNSALNQDYAGVDVEVIVSDNSETEDSYNMMLEEFSDVKYIRRVPPVSAFEHFRSVIQEAKGDLLVLFHDDDILLPNYIKVVYGAILKWPSAAAVCCNAKIIINEKKTNKSVVQKRGYDLVFEEAESFIKKYLEFSNGMGCAPFPGYLYKRSDIEGLFLDPSEGGKYSDVSFLAKLLNRKPLVWLDEICMEYRIHDSNDSRAEVIGHRLRLLRYIYKHTGINKKSKIIDQYRYKYWTNWWVSFKKEDLKRNWVKKVVKAYLIKRTIWYFFSNISFKKIYIVKIYQKLATKLRNI